MVAVHDPLDQRLAMAVQDENPDFVLSFIPTSDLSEPVPCAVWHLAFEGTEVDDEQPPLFTAAAYQQATVSVELIERSGAPLTARVLHRAELRAWARPSRTMRALQEAAPAVCVGAALRVQKRSLSSQAVPIEYPRAKVSAWRIWRDVARRTTQSIFKRLLQREVWAIGIISVPIQELARGRSLPSPQWFVTPTYNAFYADPFPVVVNGRLQVMFETWSNVKARGWIDALPLREQGEAAPHARAIDIGCHASYPGTLLHEATVYCVPEMWETGGLQIFRLAEGEEAWTFAGCILDDVPVVDPTLFVHEGRWWLLATIRGGGPDVNLHGWYSASPFGPWTPHPLNPLKSDIRSSRPAGAVFYLDGVLHRPSQDCSAGYGGAVVFNRVLRLDPDGFEEVEVVRVAAGSDWSYPDGIHTLNAYDDMVIIDAKRLIVDPLAAVWTLLPHLRRFWARCGIGTRAYRASLPTIGPSGSRPPK